MEKEMEEKPSWKLVVNRRIRRLPWDALPSLALFKIFIKLDFKDRCCSIPFVCKAWNSVISGDPLCWSSMIPESVSPDDAFIKNSVDYYSLQVYPPSSYEKFSGYRYGKWDGVSRFRSLLKRAAAAPSSSSSPTTTTTTTTITSLYLTPFTYSYPDNEESADHDEILHLIANCCPNLKHISFDGFCHASKEAMFEVFRRCKKLELIDFSESLGCPDGDLLVQLIQEFGNNLPHLRGIRILKGWKYHDTPVVNAIATHLPRIKLLDIECNAHAVPILLLSSETQLLELQYLRLGAYFQTDRLEPPPVPPTHIPEFHYEDIDYLYELYPYYCQCRPLHRRLASSRSLLCHFCTDREEYAKGEKEIQDLLLSEYYYEHSSHPIQPQDYSILKQKKEDKYYVSILKENKKKTRNHHHHRHALMRRRGLMAKKNNKAAASSSSSLKIMKKKNRDNRMYDYYAEDYVYLIH